MLGDLVSDHRFALVLVGANLVAHVVEKVIANWLGIDLLRRREKKAEQKRHKHTVAHTRPPVRPVEIPDPVGQDGESE